MADRWQGKFFEVNTDNPSSESICDRCGFRFNANRMQFQYDFRGGAAPVNTFILTCGRPTCNDELQYQNAAWNLGPDPIPIYNARVEPYTVDDTNWLTTDDGSIITTDADVPFITNEPNPSTNAAATNLNASLVYPSGSVSSVFLDLFNGNPLTNGVSILASVTGSAVRPNISSALAVTGAFIAENTDLLSVTSASLTTINVSYVGIYSAASGGTLLTSGPVGASMPITINNPIQFLALGLTININ